MNTQLKTNLITTLYPQYNCYLVKAFDTLSFQDLLDHLKRLVADDEFKPGINALYDFSQIESIQGSPEVFLSTAEHVNDERIFNQPAKTAILVSPANTVAHKIFSGYCLMTSKSVIESQVFDCAMLARDYVKLPLDLDLD